MPQGVTRRIMGSHGNQSVHPIGIQARHKSLPMFRLDEVQVDMGVDGLWHSDLLPFEDRFPFFHKSEGALPRVSRRTF
jgi:hypothetical protein